MLQKSPYPCEYMNGWETFNEASLTEKKEVLQQSKHGTYF